MHHNKYWYKVLFHKADLDTVLTAKLASVTCWRFLTSVPKATEFDLLDTQVLCIEVGGSGQVSLHNFDHHDPFHYFPPACKQAYDYFGWEDKKWEKIVHYVCLVDEGNPVDVNFPSLSNIFSGMCLLIDDPIEQFLTGLSIIDTVYVKGFDPFQALPELPEWKHFILAKEQNLAQLQQDSKNIVTFYTKTNIFCGFLESNAVGGFKILYDKGCEVGVLYSPRQNKYTIGSKHLNLTKLLQQFQSIEDGWGGRQNIFGSPYRGTKLTPAEVIKIIKETL
ncbi:MAG: hypothetical protein Q9M37_02585 [Desulfonauticus sp.]|nr:hypothetical protein [Desulfonauticus sp.]